MNMKSPCLTLPVLLLAGGLAAAQSTFTVPAAFDATGGNAGENNLASGRPVVPVRQQFLWNVRDIPIAAAALTAVDLRRASVGNVSNPAGTLTLTIDLSVGPNDAVSMSDTFAANLGGTVTRVFSGNLSLPAETGGPGPGPWSVAIPFSTPFVYIAAQGRGLVADMDVSAYTTAAGQTWSFDAATSRTITPGQRASNPSAQPNCRFSTGDYNRSLSSRPPLTGAIWYVQYGNILPNAPGLGALGTQGVGGSWAGIPLPIDLGPLGAPGCSWNVNILFTQPLVANASGQGRWPDIPVPEERFLIGQSFFDHALFVDPPANALGIVTTWSSRWTVGEAVHPEGARAFVLANTGNAPSGSLQRHVLVARFHY